MYYSRKTRLTGIVCFLHRLGGLALLSACVAVHAQTMVRCGNIYQDHPCENGQSGKVIGKMNHTDSGVKSSSDALCAQRGIDAQKMVWAREGGATQERMMQSAYTEDQRKLVLEVYNNRGSAPEVRSAVEASCVADKAAARTAIIVTTPPAPATK
ncbi:MAG TPA: hypothetical protein VNW52_01320 [Burkholderiaceae bacterium]|nr:hypothetical protein [Burkholderiaceae bacterium]